MAPQPIDKNAIDRPLGRATPLERFFFQYPKFQYKPSESPISEFKRLCKVYEQNARHRLDIAVNQARDVRGFWNKLGNVVSQPKVHPLGGVAPLEMFFAQYPKFRYDPSKSPVAEFNRLWKEYERDTRHKFNAAIKREFYDLYGTDEKNTNNWHKLCRALRIDPIPDTRKECRAAVLNKHVNLIDLLRRDDREVQMFKTEKELSEYTKQTKKYFAKENADDAGVLRALRRHILVPPTCASNRA